MARRLLVNDLNRRITLEVATESVDPEGIAVEMWQEVASVWAARRPLRGREYFEAAAVNAEKTVKYVIRYRVGIKSNMRLVDQKDGLLYSVRAVLDDYYGDRTQTHIMAELIEDG